jgi:hypothetical protein
MKMKSIAFYPANTFKPRTSCWNIPVLWLLTVLQTFHERRVKVIRVLVKDKRTGRTLDPANFDLYIQGIDLWGRYCWMEQFPPDIVKVPNPGP